MKSINNKRRRRKIKNISLSPSNSSLVNYICHTRRLLLETHDEVCDDNFGDSHMVKKYTVKEEKYFLFSLILVSYNVFFSQKGTLIPINCCIFQLIISFAHNAHFRCET